MNNCVYQFLKVGILSLPSFGGGDDPKSFSMRMLVNSQHNAVHFKKENHTETYQLIVGFAWVCSTRVTEIQLEKPTIHYGSDRF